EGRRSLHGGDQPRLERDDTGRDHDAQSGVAALRRHLRQALVVDAELLAFGFFWVDELEPERAILLPAAQLPSAAEMGRIGSVPDDLAVLQENELAAEAIG